MVNFNSFGTYVISFERQSGSMTRDDGSPFVYDNVVFHCLVCAGSRRSVVMQKVKTSVCLDIFGLSSVDELMSTLNDFVNRKVSFTCDNTKSKNVFYFEFFDNSIEISFS